MTDNLKIKRPEDPTKINIHQDYEVTYWCNEFGCSKNQLVNAVNAVGPTVKRVKEYLGI